MSLQVNLDENVANLLPQVTPSGPAISKGINNQYIDEIEKEVENTPENPTDIIDEENELPHITIENVDDVALNTETDTPISRGIRKQLLKAKLALRDYEISKKTGTKETIFDKKNELKFENQKLADIKKTLNSDELKALSKIEKEIDKEIKKMPITIEKEDKEVKESVEEVVEENVINRLLAKTDNDAKGRTVLKCWGKFDFPITEEKAKDMIANLEKKASIDEDIHTDSRIIPALALTNYPVGKFIKIAKKFKEKKVYTDAMLKGDTSMTPEEIKKAEDQWNKNKMVVVCRDGFGNLLLFSLKDGKFFDYYHEEDSGKDLTWLKSGVKYNDLINECKKNIAKANEEVKKEAADDSLTKKDKLEDKLVGLEQDLTSLNDDIKETKEKLDNTGENRFEVKLKGLNIKKDKLEKQIDDLKAEIKSKKAKAVTEAANMEDEIKPIVDKLNSLGYKVKYASPGHNKLRKKEDNEPDGVFYGKLYSDARIMFEDKYSFPKAPKYWKWREVDGCSYLDIIEHEYDDKKDGTPDEAFSEWKDKYMASLREFVDSLEEKDTEKETKEEIKESVNFMDESNLIMESLMLMG